MHEVQKTKTNLTGRRQKIITALSRMDADIIGILEMENDGWGEDSAIYDLVKSDNGLSKQSGKNYDYVTTADRSNIGTDVIKVSLVYNKDTVEPVGEVKIIDDTFPFDKDTKKHRPPMIQTFKDINSGKEITVAINHFKSKGSKCTELEDPTDKFWARQLQPPPCCCV